MLEYPNPQNNIPDKGRSEASFRRKSADFFKKYLKLLDEYRLGYDDFKDIYSPEEIRNDKNKVEKSKLGKNEATIRGELFEGILIEQAELSNWFGQDSRLIALTEYDDRFSATDFVIEIKNKDGEIIRILVDATTSVNREIIKEKLEKSMDLKEKKLADIKYFKSEMEDYRGKLRDMPRVVIGIDPYSLEDLCIDVYEKKNQQDKNPVQFIILNEMFQQFNLLYNVCKNNDFNSEMISKVEKAKNVIDDLLKEKEGLRTNKWKAKRDKTYDHLISLS